MSNSENKYKPKIVYLVYAPERVDWSAGIKILYKLHDAIGESGREVHLINHGKSKFRTKFRTARLIAELNSRRKDLVFVALYTESTLGNPLKTRSVIRWILNYPGLLGGESEFKDEFLLAYSENIARRTPLSDKSLPSVLFVPALSLEEINFLKPLRNQNSGKKHDLIYAQKYRALGGSPDSQSDNDVEITRFSRKSQTRVETLESVRNSRALHVYENSTIITEAQLCNVPVYCHRNEYFDELIAGVELGDEGVTWKMDETPMCNSEAVRSRLLTWESSLVQRVDDVFTKFEQEVTADEAGELLTFNVFLLPVQHRIARFVALAKNRGFFTAFRFFLNFFKRSFRT
jgi:hypothetical protein